MTEIELKLEFLKRVLTGCVDKTNEIVLNYFTTKEYPTQEEMSKIISLDIPSKILEGFQEPPHAYTMIGIKRLDNLQFLLDHVRKNNIDGDLIETGVWKGGATIFMKLYCNLYGLNKKIFVCDSFDGLPPPSGKFDADANDKHYTYNNLKISLDTVKKNFLDFLELDDNVIFIKGFFKDTLPNNDQIQKLSLLRMDGDMYESTHDVFYSLYHKLIDNGCLIIDDYCLGPCKQCVIDFRSSQKITAPINIIDRCGIYWIK